MRDEFNAPTIVKWEPGTCDRATRTKSGEDMDFETRFELLEAQNALSDLGLSCSHS